MRDIAKPVDTFQVGASGLRTDFPPLKTLDSTPGNLKPQTTSFVGGEAELDNVQAALKQHRLVALTGVGGVGKTRPAVEVAARMADCGQRVSELHRRLLGAVTVEKLT